MLKLTRRIENGKMFFIIFDYSQGCMKDMFYFSKEGQFPLIEERIYEIMATDLESTFKNGIYSRKRYQVSLLTTYRISIENDNINFKNSIFCNDFYNYLKYDKLTDLIPYLRGKITIEGLNSCREFILQTELPSLSQRGQALYRHSESLICSTDSKGKLFKEYVELAIHEEYNTAYLRILKEQELAKVDAELVI